MLAEEAFKYGIHPYFLDASKSFPAGLISSHFEEGDFKDYDDVMAFGKDKDILTIEIENVNVDALQALETQGVKVYPQPRVIRTIKDKGLQKNFYKENNIPTSSYILVDNKSEVLQKINDGMISYPFVQKSRLAGYDGKGVTVINGIEDQDKIFDVPSVIEDKVDIEKELAVIVARNASGMVSTFMTTEMVFDPRGNLLDYLISPADIEDKIDAQCKSLALELAEKLDIIGLLAVEFFLTKNGDILINEAAPRTHNSGHHTIEAYQQSQFNLHLRTLLGWSLPKQSSSYHSGIINILGNIAGTGTPSYAGLEKIMSQEGIFPHIYGKTLSKPLRKMGHITVLGRNRQEVQDKIKFVKNTFNVEICHT